MNTLRWALIVCLILSVVRAEAAQIGGGGGGGGGGVTTDIQDGAGDSAMDAVNNALRVNIIAGAGSGGTAADDNSAFTFGTTPVTPMGCVLDDAAPNAITENNVAAPRCTSARSLMVTGPVTNAGTFAVQVDGSALTALQLIDNIVASEDAAHSDTEGVVKLGCRRIDTAATSAGTSGDWATVDCDANGALRVRIDSTAVGSTSADDDGTVTAGTTGMTETLNRNYVFNGADWKRQINVCDPRDTAQVAVTSASSGNNELVALTAGQTIYVCDIVLVSAGTVAAQLIYGTGTACATGETNMSGPMDLIVNSGFSNSPAGRLKTAEANALCIELSGAVAVNGYVTYRKAATL